MEYRRLGDSGLFVSEIGLGCNNFGGRTDQAGTQRVVDSVVDHGVTLFDTADVYGGQQSEVLLGRALGTRRQDVVVATKFGMPMGDGPLAKGGSRRYIVAAAEASLKRLGTDYIDLYQIHFPDRDTPIDETLAAMDDLVRAGKVRYIGCSNFSGWQIADADWTARHNGVTRFVSAQNHMSLLERTVEAEVVPACERFGLGMLPFFPLASGMLTGKYERDAEPPQGTRLANSEAMAKRTMTELNFDKIDKLAEFAAARDGTLLELAFAWLLSFPVVSSVIAGATSAEQVAANVACTAMQLDPDEIKTVSRLAA